MQNLTDEELITQQNLLDDDEHFKVLLDRHAQLIYGRCNSMLRNEADADDAAQAIWTKVYFALPDFRYKSTFKTWLFRIVNNHCLNVIRGRKAFFEELDENASYMPSIGLSLEETVAQKIDVTNLLNSVSKQEKAILIMKYADGYSYDEIAEQLNISVSAAKMRVTRAKERIVSNEK